MQQRPLSVLSVVTSARGTALAGAEFPELVRHLHFSEAEVMAAGGSEMPVKSQPG